VNRVAEADVLPYARSHGRVVIAHSPLAHGLLSGRYDRSQLPPNAARRANPLFLPENLDRAGELLATLRAVADAHAVTSSQVALAWVIREPGVVAIPGAATVEQLEENVAAAEIDLADDEYRALSDAASRFRPVPRAASRTDRIRGRVAGRLAG
jgi:aryl-alcohol dehydrogenase-like predicted oxidoreductase